MSLVAMMTYGPFVFPMVFWIQHLQIIIDFTLLHLVLDLEIDANGYR